MVAAIGLLCVPQFAVLSYATVFLHDHGHLGLAEITAVMVALQAGAMIMRIWSGRHTDRRANRPAYLRGSALVALAAFMLLGLAAGVPAAPAADGRVVAAGIAVSAWHGVAYRSWPRKRVAPARARPWHGEHGRLRGPVPHAHRHPARCWPPAAGPSCGGWRGWWRWPPKD
jgi:MFS family permease